MKIQRLVTEPIRANLTWEESWNAADHGLITCWECGRDRALQDPELAARARSGQLVLLPWKGGVEKAIKKKQKYGVYYYLAMWQGLRGEDLNVDPERETLVTCTASKMDVVFTGDYGKYANA